MERFYCFNTDDEPMELPPGFRFHPTDEELVTHYLSPKVLDSSFSTKAIGEVDLNKVEPWDLPCKLYILDSVNVDAEAQKPEIDLCSNLKICLKLKGRQKSGRKSGIFSVSEIGSIQQV